MVGKYTKGGWHQSHTSLAHDVSGLHSGSSLFSLLVGAYGHLRRAGQDVTTQTWDVSKSEEDEKHIQDMRVAQCLR